MNDTEVTAGDALQAIAEADGGVDSQALKMVGDIMDYNARSYASLMDDLLEGEKRAHEETRERLRLANERLYLIERRVLWLLGHELWEGE